MKNVDSFVKNVDSPSHTPVAQGDHPHFTKRISNIDASQFALGNTGVCRLGAV
jgi:hypothetical protein